MAELSPHLYAAAGRRPLLSAADERSLARRVADGDDTARHEMIEANLRLVVFIARRYLGHGLELEDLVQEGVVGLDRAVRRFDWRRGFRFSTFARWWIHRQLQVAVTNTGATIRRPEQLERTRRLALRRQSGLEQALGRKPSVVEIADAASLSPAEVVRALGVPEHVTLDHAEGTEDPSSDDALELAARSEQQRRVRLCLEGLPELERRVLELRFGLDGRRRSYDDCGAALGLSRDRVRLLERSASARLRELVRHGGC